MGSTIRRPRGYRAGRTVSRKLADRQGSVLYANLAIRGRTTRQIREQQLGRAVAMRPDLATVVAGTNDVLRRRFDPQTFGDDLEAMQSALVNLGATVLTFTLPDLTPVMPFARVLGDRVARMNDAIRSACAHTGAILCDFAAYPVASDPRLWSDDRLQEPDATHASPRRSRSIDCRERATRERTV
jgi:lysophospholipase L1-like esterase